jgi:ABC-2 type transport system ATP-binding protein
VVAASNGLGRDAVDRALGLTGIADLADLPAGRMSLGMRQRVGLAAALIGDPAVLVLDEPHNGLDTAAIRWLRVVLRALADAGRTILVSSHLMSEMERICDDVVVIDHGRIRVTSSMAAFLGRRRSAGASLEERYLDLVSGP